MSKTAYKSHLKHFYFRNLFSKENNNNNLKKKQHFEKMFIRSRISVLCILSCVTLANSFDDVIPREPQHYQDVIQNAIHAREKYLKSSNKDIINHQQEKSKLIKDSGHNDISSRAARLLQGDPVDAPTDWRFDVSDVCLNHTEMFLEGLVSLEPWALRSKIF